MKNIQGTLKTLAKGKKLLLVEDDEKTLHVFENFLKEFFPLIKTASRGDDAWEMYRKENFDLVISDIEMPGTNGVMLAKGIKARNPNQAILITSAYTEDKYLIELINIGVDGFLKKPVNIHNLYDRIIKCLRMVQVQAETSRLQFKAITKEITKKEIKETKSHHQRLIEQETLKNSKISVLDFLEKIKISDPESYEFFNTQKENLLEFLNDLVDNYEFFAFKSYSEFEHLENIINDFARLNEILTIFNKVKESSAQIERLISILDQIKESDLNESKENAFDILEFLINDFKQFIIDMFVENNVEDINYFHDSFKENITSFEQALNNSEDEDIEEIEFL